MIWVEMRHQTLLPGWQSRCVLVGFAAVGEGAITGISLDVTFPAFYADPALANNCFAVNFVRQGRTWLRFEDFGLATFHKKRASSALQSHIFKIILLSQVIQSRKRLNVLLLFQKKLMGWG